MTSERYMLALDELVAKALASGVPSGVVVGHLLVAMERLAHHFAESDGEGSTGPEILASWLELVRARTALRDTNGLRH